MHHCSQIAPSGIPLTLSAPSGKGQSRLSEQFKFKVASFGKRISFAFLLALSIWTVPESHAESEPCEGSLFIVDVGNADLHQRICKLASTLRAELEQCQLSQSRLLRIEVVPDLSHPLGNCLSYFDCDYDLIRLTDPAKYSERLDPETAYGLVPPDVTLQALLTHELAHALLSQTAEPRAIDMVDQEYVAAAMELELLDPEWREVFVKAAPVSLPPKVGLIDAFIYGMAPRKFAVNAWQHFSLPENGCDLIGRIARGETTFATPR